MPIDTSIYANSAPRSNIMNTVVQAYNLKDMMRRSKQAEELAPFQKREAEALAKAAEQALQGRRQDPLTRNRAGTKGGQ